MRTTSSKRRHVSRAAAVAMVAGLLPGICGAQPQYELIDLGTLGNVSGPGLHLGPWWPVTAQQPDPGRYVKNLDGSVALGLNDGGQVVGIAAPIGAAGFGALYSTVPFRWDSGTITELPSPNAPAAGSISLANAINNAGVAVGSAANFFVIQPTPAVKWDPAQPGNYIALPSLFPLDPEDCEKAVDINNNGQILTRHIDCCWCLGATTYHTTLIEPNGQMTEVYYELTAGGGGVPGPGEQYTSATAMNDAGQVIGLVETYTWSKFYVWQNGQFLFPDWGAFAYMEVLDINNAGVVVGVANTASEPYQMAALWTPPYTQPQTLTPSAQNPGMDWSTAYSINNHGEVVGSYAELHGCPWCHRFRAFHWQNGTLTHLSDLIPAGSNFTALLHAYKINDNGDIAGVGLTNDPDIIHAFLLKRTDTPCYADCNGSGSLTIADFTCFQTKFVAGDPYADCNQSGGLTVADFTCFQSQFVAGCP